MRPRTFGLVAAALFGVAALSPAQGPPPVEKQEARAQGVELLAEAYRLAEFAQQHKAPEAYVAAGALVLRLQALTDGKMGELDIKPQVQDEDDRPVKHAEVKTEEAEKLDAIAERFFTSASALALTLNLGAQTEAMIKAARARKYLSAREEADKKIENRGALGGPRVLVCVLPARQTHVFKIPFDTYSIASIGFQANALLRCKMHIGSFVHFEQVFRIGQYTWKPAPDKVARTFTITIKNPNNFAVTYKLLTN